MSRGEPIPIIFITSRADEDVVSRAMADGAVACLLKPFTEDALLKAISLSLSR
jgi:FixJ family two-component response regulator